MVKKYAAMHTKLNLRNLMNLMKADRVLQRHHAASLMAMQCAVRVSGLMGIGMIGSFRKGLDTYMLCLQHSASYVKNAHLGDTPEAVSAYADVMSECVEKSWQDYRNTLQIILLTQDQALIWSSKIYRALTNV